MIIHNKFCLKKLSVGIFIATSIMPEISQAASGLEIETIMVTARKIEENIQETPIAVSALSADEMELRGAENLVDIGSYAPNVNLSTGASFSGSSSAPAIFIRGIGQQDFVNTSDPAVGIYVDGVYAGRAVGGLMDTLDLERAEILRGPQGTLFGRNNIGGAINLISKKPDPDAGFYGKASATIGEENHREGQFSANIPLTDSSAGRIAGLIRKRDGFVDAVQYDDLKLGNDDSLSLRGQLRFLLSDDLTLDFSADFTHENEAPAALVPTALGDLPTFSFPDAGGPDPRIYNLTQGDACDSEAERNVNLNCYGNAHVLGGYQNNSLWTDSNGNPVTPENKLDLWGVSMSLDWDIGVGSIQSISAYRELESSFFMDLDFSPFPLFHNSTEQFDQEQFSQEIQFTGNFLDERLKVVSGIYYFQEEAIQAVGVNRFGGSASIRPNPNGSFFQDSIRNVKNTSAALFGQATYDVSEILHVTMGLRYTKEEKEFDLTIDRTANNNTIFGPISGKQTTNEVTPLFTIGWNSSEKIYNYFTFSQGFRSGGFPTRFTGLFPEEIPSYDPEYVDNFELGIKMDLLDDRLRMNLAAFIMKYDDIQTTATPVSPELEENATTTDNLASAEIRGIEGEILAVVTDDFRIDLNFGILDAEIKDVLGGGLNSSGIIITEDNELPFMPKINATLGFTYLLPLNNGGELRARADVRYVDEQYFRVENIPEAHEDSYTTVNASLTYVTEQENWEVSLGIKNLTNSDHFANKSYSEEIPNSAFGNIARPRNVHATFRYFFGDY